MRKRLIAAAFVLTALVGGCVPGIAGRRALIQPQPSASFTQDLAPPPRSKTADVVERVLPSVVNVRIRGFRQTGFGTEDVRGEGSGIVIDSNGTILTNNHVVQDAVQVRVFFTDGHDPVDGTVVGTDPDRDLAVVKVPVDDLQAIDIGSSGSLRLGDSVIALGFPLGLGGPTVTSGIVSGKERNLTIPREGLKPENLEGLLQTDAAINPGNSGGPLIDAAGRLVGINTAAAGAGSAENVGFAIGIDTAIPVVEEILSKPAEKRAWLGVLVSNLDPSTASQLNLPSDVQGALITETVPNAPAAEAGLDQGDVITAIDGDQIRSAEDLTRVLTQHEPGETVTVEIVNSNGSDSVQVTLAQRPVPPEEG